MKKIFLNLTFMATSFAGNCQSFSIPNDTVRAVVDNSMNLHNDITNISSGKINVSWRVKSHDFPGDWRNSFAICDNKLCYYNNNGSLMPSSGAGPIHVTDTINIGQTGNFYVLPDLTNAGPGSHYVEVEMSDGAYIKNSWYYITKWPTGVISVSKNEMPLTIYPNPASNELTLITADNNLKKAVSIIDISGREVIRTQMNTSSIKLDVSSLPAGDFFIKMLEKNNEVPISIKFEHK